MSWPRACVNMVFVGGVIVATIMLKDPSCLWALLFLIFWN